jgi:hypothetical protein
LHNCAFLLNFALKNLLVCEPPSDWRAHLGIGYRIAIAITRRREFGAPANDVAGRLV